MKRIVLVAGFESFNADLYRKAADLAIASCPELDIRVFSDRDITSKRQEVEAALAGADVFLVACCLITIKCYGCAIALRTFPSVLSSSLHWN